VTVLRATAGDTKLPAPPEAPSPADFPTVPVIEPPRLPPGRGAGLAVGLALVVAIAAGLKWVSGGAFETAPLLFLAVAAAGWWLDQRGALLLAATGAIGWVAASLSAATRIGQIGQLTAIASGILLAVCLVAGALLLGKHPARLGDDPLVELADETGPLRGG